MHECLRYGKRKKNKVKAQQYLVDMVYMLHPKSVKKHIYLLSTCHILLKKQFFLMFTKISRNHSSKVKYLIFI